MQRVYITNKGAHNYDDAKQYGELYYCTTGTVDKNDVQQMYRELEHALMDSEPEDFLLLTSLASLCSVACAIFAHKHGRLNLLIYSDGAYLARKLFLE